MWDAFVPYENAEAAATNKIPRHVKWNSTLVIDAGYDISHWLHTDRNVMMAVYAALSGVSTTFAPLALSETQKTC